MTTPPSSSILPHGRLGNLAKAAFVPTPPSVAEAIMANLLRVGEPPRTPVLDPAAGEGDLLLPAFERGMPCFGVEIERERAARARARLPGSTILTAPFEAVTARNRFSLLLVNPPYLAEAGGQREEYVFVKKAGAWLRPGGILVAVIPARSAWSALIQHLVRSYEDIRVWRLPEQVADGPGFSAYTQLIVCARRRARAVTPASPEQFAEAQAEAARLQEIAWANGRWQQQVPPELPASPLPDPYEVPPAERMPSLFLEVESTEAEVIWQFLPPSGLEQHAHWRWATEGQGLQEEADRPQELVMPYSSSTLAHLAAKILSGVLNGRFLRGLGPTASQGALFQAFVIQQWSEVPLTAEEEEALRLRHTGVQRAYARLRHELPVVGLLSKDGWHYLTGPEALRFLAQAQEQLVQQLLALPHRVAYPLDPTDRELEILLEIGRDKQLAGVPWPGLADQQIHAILGMYRALERSRRVVLLQAEPGTGKTRMCTGLAALLAAAWRQRRPGQRWIKRLRRAWLKVPFLRDLLGVEPVYEARVSGTGLEQPQRRPRLVGYRKAGTDQLIRPRDAGPSSLPVLVTTPLRVALEYQREVEACWPEAEVHLVRTVDEARAWLQRCATSQAPAVVGIVPHSRSQALDQSWRPAVLERKRDRTVFCCPDCGQVITARPWQALGEAAGEEEEQGDLVKPAARPSDLPPVGSRRWFELRPRWHQCPDGKRAALFTFCRRPETERRLRPLAFAEWSRLIKHHRPPDHVHGWRLSVVGEQVEWSKVPATHSLSPFEWLYRFARGAIGLVIVDESHNARSRSSDLARCIQLALAAGQQGVLASGTHYGGNIEGLFHYWYRLVDAALWKRWGLSWAEIGRAQELFGMIRSVVKEYEPPPSSKKRRGDMIVHTSTSSAPGISVRLLPFLLDRMVFLSLQDMGALMPPLREIPILVRLEDSQVQAAWTRAAQLREHSQLLRRQAASAEAGREEADEIEEEARSLLEEARELEAWAEARDLRGAYLRLCRQMEEDARTNQTVRMACATLPRWFVCLPCDKPFQLVLTRRSAWGDEEGQEVALSTPVLAWDHLYPLERKLQELISQELAEERRVLVYVEQSRERSMARRLSFVLREWQHWLWTLPDQVKPEERQQAIWHAVAQGKRIIIAQYRAVSEGLNLQFLDSIVWFELPLNLFLLDQASRRCWRLGRQGEVRVYYLAYAGTPAHAKLVRLGQQHGAASAFAGQLAEGGLSETTAADQTALAQLTLHLSSHEEVPGREQGSDHLALLMSFDGDIAKAEEQLTQAFERRRVERQHRRQWFGGYEDRLRERLAQWHHLGTEVQRAQDPPGREGSSPGSAPQQEGTSARIEVPPPPQPEPGCQEPCLEEPDPSIETRRPAEEHAPPVQTQASPAAAAEQDQVPAAASVAAEPEARTRLVFGDSALLSALAAAKRRRRLPRASSSAGAVQSCLWDGP